MLGLLRVGLGVLLLLWAEEAPCRYVERLAGESEVLPRPGRHLGPSIRQEEVICAQKASLQGDLELGQALQLILPKGVQVRAHPFLLKRRVNMAARKQSVKSLLDELAEKAALHWQWDTAPQTLLFKAREGQAPPKETIARPRHGAGNVPHTQPNLRPQRGQPKKRTPTRRRLAPISLPKPVWRKGLPPNWVCVFRTFVPGTILVRIPRLARAIVFMCANPRKAQRLWQICPVPQRALRSTMRTRCVKRPGKKSSLKHLP